MIPLVPKWLFYISQEKSFAAIARATGIPYRTVLRLREPGVKITSVMKQGLRNMFQRESYGRLRRTGFSAKEARRWSWYRPEHVVIKDMAMKNRIHYLTSGSLAERLESKGLRTTAKNIDEIYDEVYEEIRKKISKSPKSTEDIESS